MAKRVKVYVKKLTDTKLSGFIVDDNDKIVMPINLKVNHPTIYDALLDNNSVEDESRRMWMTIDNGVIVGVGDITISSAPTVTSNPINEEINIESYVLEILPREKIHKLRFYNTVARNLNLDRNYVKARVQRMITVYKGIVRSEKQYIWREKWNRN